MKKLTLAALALVCAAAMAQVAPSWKRAVLPNGLVVIAVEDRAAATAAVHLGVRFDPAGVPAAKAGLAAVSQQLHQAELRELLKEKAWQRLSQELSGTQAVLILNTEVDYCELRGKVSDGLLPQALQVAGRIQFGAAPVGEEQLRQVREVLKAAQEDAAERLLELTYDRFLRALLGATSPLTRPVLGTPETVAAVTAADVTGFRRDYMGPNNAVLTVIAPRPVGDVVDLAKLTLGECATAQTRVQPPVPPVLSRSRASVAQQEGWRGVSLMVGVPAPAYGTLDFLKTQLVYTLLEGEGGRLAKDPVLRGGLVNNRIARRDDQPFPVTILPPMATPRPFLAMHMVVAPREMEAAHAALLKHFEALAQQPPTEAELQRAKERLINSYAVLRLARMDFAKNVSCVELYGGDWNLISQAEDAIAAITAAEVMALAREYFQHHAVGVLMPGDDRQMRG